MKSKPYGILFGLLAIVAILGVAPAFGQTANEIDMAKGVSDPKTAACIPTNNCFYPNPLTVTSGTTVTWKNTGDSGHTVLSGKPSDDSAGSLFDSSPKQPLKPGETFQFTFANAGTYDYFCGLHPWMVGQVIVTASSVTPAPTTPAPTNNATVPEFGPVASIVLAIAVLSMIVFAAKTRVIPRLYN